MITCIAIDDEPIALNIIDEYINKLNFLELKGTFRNAIDALNYLQKNTIALIFLDIDMPDLDGVQFVNLLPYPKPQIIFCTAHSKYAVESYTLEILDYLLKPIEFERFLKSALKAKANVEQRSSVSKLGQTKRIPEAPTGQPVSILIKSGNEIQKINLKEISYIEGTGNYITIHTQSKRILSLQSMKGFMQHLPSDIFFRVHKSFIVSFDFVDTIENHQIKIGNKSIRVGSTYRNEFKQWLSRK